MLGAAKGRIVCRFLRKKQNHRSYKAILVKSRMIVVMYIFISSLVKLTHYTHHTFAQSTHMQVYIKMEKRQPEKRNEISKKGNEM